MILNEHLWKIPVKNCIVGMLLACPINNNAICRFEYHQHLQLCHVSYLNHLLKTWISQISYLTNSASEIGDNFSHFGHGGKFCLFRTICFNLYTKSTQQH